MRPRSEPDVLRVVLRDHDPRRLILAIRALDARGARVTASRGGLDLWEAVRRARPRVIALAVESPPYSIVRTVALLRAIVGTAPAIVIHGERDPVVCESLRQRLAGSAEVLGPDDPEPLASAIVRQHFARGADAVEGPADGDLSPED